ncbi:MAG: AAA family ATPase, partial [Micrococcales bacterium]|nr:AAA family ATPase [Micrococcales bacterium]
RDEIRDWYNGYNWTGQAVYNPFDVLLLFRKRQFRSYWFETGTPTFLVETLAQRQVHRPAPAVTGGPGLDPITCSEILRDLQG